MWPRLLKWLPLWVGFVQVWQPKMSQKRSFPHSFIINATEWVLQCSSVFHFPPPESEHVMTVHVLADLFNAWSVLSCTDTLQYQPTCSACFYVSKLRWHFIWMNFPLFDVSSVKIRIEILASDQLCLVFPTKPQCCCRFWWKANLNIYPPFPFNYPINQNDSFLRTVL